MEVSIINVQSARITIVLASQSWPVCLIGRRTTIQKSTKIDGSFSGWTGRRTGLICRQRISNQNRERRDSGWLVESRMASREDTPTLRRSTQRTYLDYGWKKKRTCDLGDSRGRLAARCPAFCALRWKSAIDHLHAWRKVWRGKIGRCSRNLIESSSEGG